jgi:putative nucleotidyltransferase with HDIG domain
VTADTNRSRPSEATAVASLVLVVGAIGFGLSDLSNLLTWFAIVLTVCATAAEFISARYAGVLRVSGVFMCGNLAVGFLGPAPAFAIPAVAHLVVWGVDRYRWRALLINLAGSATLTLAVAAAFDLLAPDEHTPLFFLLLALAGAMAFLGNVLTVVPLMAVLDGNPVRRSLHAFVGIWPTVALNIGLAVALAGIYADVGLSALAFMLLLIAAFTYMARLLVEARERTRQYANLSWGVLSGLVRTLDERDSRAARHCAAVAAFSRDMARHMGMDKRDQELAHTAGLLHDIGKFALSDRVMERGAKLLESDWRGIRRHPDIGAELLRDIGVYGPVAEIIRAHHERIDGRGYPHGLKGEDIPPIAKIVAVAEVYDTLTAPDTYRTPMTSFEALNELRRVAGTQLDGDCVEALAELLAGRGTDYRHADEADFDRELDIERRMNEAVAP